MLSQQLAEPAELTFILESQVFPIIHVPDDAPEYWEQLGTKRKFWFGDRLCKFGRPNTGEDWSEKLAAELAEGLGLPHAGYELGMWKNERCVVSPNIVPADCSLITGNELLGRYQPYYSQAVKYKQSAHTLDAIWDVFEQSACELPLNWDAPRAVRTAQDVFVGYLLLDTLIGNTDRHDENWALIQAPEEAVNRRHLAPTFDHASSLGCHETDDGRNIRLETRDIGRSVEAYADRSRSALYATPNARQPLRNLEALTLASHNTRRAIKWWLERLDAIDDVRIDILLEEIPNERMSSAAAAFARRMILHNRKRILNAGLNS